MAYIAICWKCHKGIAWDSQPLPDGICPLCHERTPGFDLYKLEPAYGEIEAAEAEICRSTAEWHHGKFVCSLPKGHAGQHTEDLIGRSFEWVDA